MHGESRAGELLEGTAWADLPDFTDWLLAWRGRLDGKHTSTWRAQAQGLEGAGAYREALAVTPLLRDLDPTSEDALRREMRLHYLLGNAALALEVYGGAATLLRGTLGTDPLPETRQLALDIGRSVARPPTLVGREAAWAQMEAAWARGRASS